MRSEKVGMFELDVSFQVSFLCRDVVACATTVRFHAFVIAYMTLEISGLREPSATFCALEVFYPGVCVHVSGSLAV